MRTRRLHLSATDPGSTAVAASQSKSPGIFSLPTDWQALSWNTSLLLATDLKLICKEKNASVKMLVQTKFWEEYGQYGTYNGSGLIRDSLRRLYERGLFRRKHWTNCRRLLASAIISQRRGKMRGCKPTSGTRVRVASDSKKRRG